MLSYMCAIKVFDNYYERASYPIKQQYFPLLLGEIKQQFAHHILVMQINITPCKQQSDLKFARISETAKILSSQSKLEALFKSSISDELSK